MQRQKFDANGNLLTTTGTSSTDAANVTYTPSTLADWNSSTDPGNTDDALDQLADRTTTLEAAGSSGLPFNYLKGFKLRKLSASTLQVSAGSAAVNGTLAEKTTGEVLSLATAGHWIGGSSNEASSSWINVYVDASGNLRLHNKLPNFPSTASTSPVASALVAQGTWNGTAGLGLNATTITYDNDTNEGSIEAGMYLLVYGSADSDYSSGRGKGSAAAASVNALSCALITSVNTGPNSIDVEAGHNIGIQDNDRLFVVEAGALLYRYESGTWYRWLGAIWNNSSGDLDANRLATASSYTVNEGSDYSTTSTSLVDVDSTNLTATLVLEGNQDARVDFVGNTLASTAIAAKFDLVVDGVVLAGDDGILAVQVSNTQRTPVVVSRTIRNLLPGTHTITLQWRTTSGTLTLYAGAGSTNYDMHPQFAVRALP